MAKIKIFDPERFLEGIGALVTADTDDLITVGDAARLRGVRLNTLTGMAASGRLKIYKIGHFRLIRLSDLNSLPPVGVRSYKSGKKIKRLSKAELDAAGESWHPVTVSIEDEQ